MTGRRLLNRSQSFLSAPISNAGIITTAAVNSVVCLSALKTVPVSYVKTGCQKLGQRKPRLQHREIAAKAARKETEMMDDSVELHAPRDAFPTKRTKSEDSSKAKRSKTATS